MSSSWHTVLVKCRYEPRILPYVLAIIRLSACFWPQTGYLHPDEFFQSPEVVASDHYQSKVQKTWEFTTDKPIRCMLLPVILNKLAFLLIKLLVREPGAYALLVGPRLIYTLMSFIIDYCLYKLCQYYSSRGLWYLPVSIIYQTSFICLGCLARTLSNVTETIIFSLLLVVVCQLIRPRFRILFVTPTRSRPAHEQVKRSTQLVSSLSVGTLLALGTFNRPTFPCFAFVPMLYWTFESFKRNSYNIRLNIQRVLTPLAISFFLISLCISAFDTYYYSQAESPIEIVTDAMKLLIKFDFARLYDHMATHWIITPYNFIRYNSNTENLANHTIHAPYVHLAVNVPLAFNVLGLMFYGKLFNLMVGSGVYRLIFSTHRVYALMILSVLASIISLSFIPHQEFRFLLPLIVPLVYTFAFNVYANNSWLSLWMIINVFLIYFYSSVHQAGVTKAILGLDPILKVHLPRQDSTYNLIDVMAFKCYLVPSYQWNISLGLDSIHFDLQNTHDDLAESLNYKMDLAIHRHQNIASSLGQGTTIRHTLYLMLPTIYSEQVQNQLSEQFNETFSKLRLVEQYWPHFSGEDFDNSMDYVRKYGWRQWRDAFGFSILKTMIE